MFPEITIPIRGCLRVNERCFVINIDLCSFKIVRFHIPLCLICVIIHLATMSNTKPKVPIVYHPQYNISFFGIESFLHSFDSKKYGRVFNALPLQGVQTYEPSPLNDADLEFVHTKAYLASLSSSLTIAQITEIPFLAMFPNFILRNVILNAMKLATSGTIMASELALEHGWAINLSGGYHHAKPDRGEGFCALADIPLAIRKLKTAGKVDKVLIVDLDAHQGNGFQTLYSTINTETEEVTYKKDSTITILDFYNNDIYPGDTFAKTFIKYKGELRSGTKDKEYVQRLGKLLPKAIEDNTPDIIFYNAGTDIYEDDPLGALSISAEGIMKRDEYVFAKCREYHIPIVMVLSGGYTRESANIIANSIKNLHAKGLINLNGSSSESGEEAAGTGNAL